MPEGDALLFNLAQNLAKWDKTTNINEADHHNITGVMLTPKSPQKQLNGLTLQRDAMGNLVLWGATAVATSEVASGGSGGTTAAGGGGGASGGAGGVSGGAGGGSAGGTAGGLGGSVPAGSGGTAGSVTSGGAGAGGSSFGGAGSMAPTAIAPTNDGGCSVSGARRGDWALLAILGALLLGRRRR